MDFGFLLDLVKKGDVAGLDALTARENLETISDAGKNELTRAAAKAGQARMLRHLFEAHHLFAADPDEEGRTLLHEAAGSGNAETAAHFAAL